MSGRVGLGRHFDNICADDDVCAAEGFGQPLILCRHLVFAELLHRGSALRRFERSRKGVEIGICIGCGILLRLGLHSFHRVALAAEFNAQRGALVGYRRHLDKHTARHGDIVRGRNAFKQLYFVGHGVCVGLALMFKFYSVFADFQRAVDGEIARLCDGQLLTVAFEVVCGAARAPECDRGLLGGERSLAVIRYAEFLVEQIGVALLYVVQHYLGGRALCGFDIREGIESQSAAH